MKKSPIKFVGMGTAAALGAASMYGLGQVGTFSGRGQGMPGIAAGATPGFTGGETGGIGTGPINPNVNPGSQFNPEAIQAANGIFGNVNARQAAVGASGIFRNTSKYNNV
jgi:hypothetical protein